MITKQDAENALLAMHPKFDEEGYAWIIRTGPSTHFRNPSAVKIAATPTLAALMEPSTA